ncbi:hypothetical protein D6C92_04925 [Aureobasidium pullulans]|nr:hypothetical protein D6C92_04925 [Aureobasidium pullulans]
MRTTLCLVTACGRGSSAEEVARSNLTDQACTEQQQKCLPTTARPPPSPPLAPPRAPPLTGILPADNLVKKANGQKSVAAAPSGFKFIFEDEMLQHLMLLNS